MGESTVDASNNEDKMGKKAPSSPGLEVSVSFGRFENDSLSWEKWSTFSPNKYLEEVEKCATPGSVAKKKAYFEEHYKKIAARKAELQGQGKLIESKSLKSDYQNFEDLIGKSSGQISGEVIKQETVLVSEASEFISTDVDGQDQEPTIPAECQSSTIVEVNEEIDIRLEGSELNKPEEAVPEDVVLVKEEAETPSKDSQDIQLQHNLEEKTEATPKGKNSKEKNAKLDHRLKSHKVTPLDEERNTAKLKKKPASPVSKIPQFSTPRVSKPTSTPSPMFASRSSTKTGTSSSSRRKNPSLGESKKVAPKSLHMSLSMEPSGSSPASFTTPTTRKSLIMEKMGDKEIVKRAFKTFQNNYKQPKSSTPEQSAKLKQVPAKRAESKVSTLMTPRKENGGSLRAGSVEKKNAKAAPSSFGLKSDDRSEKRKEFTKKLEGKSNAREAERTHLQTKSKQDREAEIKNLGQSLNFKATPVPGFYRGQKLSKSLLDKEIIKGDIHR